MTSTRTRTPPAGVDHARSTAKLLELHARFRPLASRLLEVYGRRPPWENTYRLLSRLEDAIAALVARGGLPRVGALPGIDWFTSSPRGWSPGRMTAEEHHALAAVLADIRGEAIDIATGGGVRKSGPEGEALRQVRSVADRLRSDLELGWERDGHTGPAPYFPGAFARRPAAPASASGTP